MSTGLNCEFFESPAGTHYYALEQGSAPKNAWNWREHANGYGPFPSFDAAYEHLHANHANPGSYTQVGVVNPAKEHYRDLIAEAPERTRTLASRRRPELGSLAKHFLFFD
jgi:hypothetical protein